jgi:hypothetical protein
MYPEENNRVDASVLLFNAIKRHKDSKELGKEDEADAQLWKEVRDLMETNDVPNDW